MGYDCWSTHYTVLSSSLLEEMMPEECMILQKALLVLQFDWEEVAVFFSDQDEYECIYQDDEVESREPHLEAIVIIINNIIDTFKNTYDLSLILTWLEEPDKTCDLTGGAYWVIEDSMTINPKFATLTNKFGNIPIQLSHTVCG